MRTAHLLVVTVVFTTLRGAARAEAQTAVTWEGGIAILGRDFAGTVPQVGLRVAAIRPNRLNVDFALAVFPTILGEGALLAMPDLDVAYVLPAGEQVLVAPRVGVSALAGVGEGGGGALPGYNVGLGVVARVQPSLAIRVDYTYRRLLVGEESYPLTSLSFGIGWTH